MERQWELKGQHVRTPTVVDGFMKKESPEARPLVSSKGVRMGRREWEMQRARSEQGHGQVTPSLSVRSSTSVLLGRGVTHSLGPSASIS